MPGRTDICRTELLQSEQKNVRFRYLSQTAMGGDSIVMDQYLPWDPSCEDLFLRGMMDRYSGEKKRMLRKRKELEEKETIEIEV